MLLLLDSLISSSSPESAKERKKHYTLAKTIMIYPKNVRAKEAVDFTQNKYLALRTIEKMKILGAVLELPAKQHCQSSPFTSKLGQIDQIF